MLDLAGADTTEIEIGVPLAFDPRESSPEDLPVLECRDTTVPSPLHNRPAGPVSDSLRNTPSGTPAGNRLERGEPVYGQFIQEPAVPQGRAVFAIDDMDSELDETIIITAPFDIHSTAESDDPEGADWNTGSANMTSTGTPASSATSQKPASTATLESNQEVLEEIEELPVRPGFFRRLLAAIRLPFGRRKPA